MSREKQFGVLLVTGAQTHQENYAGAFLADPRCRLVGLTDEPNVSKRRRQLNERMARELDLPYIPDLDRALARQDVHAVSICAEPERRGRIALRCARAGKHLYLDKSLTPRLAEADQLVRAVRASGVRSHMYSFITRPWAQRTKRIVDSGRLGTLQAIHADTNFAKGRQGTARLGSARQERYPPRPETFQTIEAKRELDNVGVYPVSLVRWLTGLEYRTVFGTTGNYFFKEHQGRDVEDFGLLMLTMEGDLPVTVSAARAGWTSHPASGSNRLILAGSRRTLVVDTQRPRLELYDDQPPWQPPPVNPTDPMGFWSSTQQEVHTMPKLEWLSLSAQGSDASYFLDCLEEDRESEMSVVDAAATTEVLLAGYRSAASGDVVTLPLPRD